MNDFKKGSLLKQKYRTVYSWPIGDEKVKTAKLIQGYVIFYCEYSQISNHVNSKLSSEHELFCIVVHNNELRVARKDALIEA